MPSGRSDFGGLSRVLDTSSSMTWPCWLTVRRPPSDRHPLVPRGQTGGSTGAGTLGGRSRTRSGGRPRCDRQRPHRQMVGHRVGRLVTGHPPSERQCDRSAHPTAARRPEPPQTGRRRSRLVLRRAATATRPNEGHYALGRHDPADLRDHQAALEQAVKWGWITANPANGSSPPRVGPSVIDPPAVGAVNTLLSMVQASQPEFYA